MGLALRAGRPGPLPLRVPCVCVSHSDDVSTARRDVGGLGRFVVSSCACLQKELLGGQSATDGAYRRRIAAPLPLKCAITGFCRRSSRCGLLG